MRNDALDRLRRENPLPDLLPELPIERILRRLDDEPPIPHRRRSSRSPVRDVLAHAVPIALSVAIVVAVAAVLLTAGSKDPSASGNGDRIPVNPGQSTSTSSGRDRIALTPAEALLDYLMPRNGTDYTSGAMLNEFTVRTRAKAETACLAAQGLPGPPQPGLYRLPSLARNIRI